MAEVPIRKFDDRVAAGLSEVLWPWQRCVGFKSDKACQCVTTCTSYIPRAKRYFQFYKEWVLEYHDALPPQGHPFKTHGDIWKAISILTNRPELTRAELDAFISTTSPALIVKITCMIDCSNLHYSPGRLEEGNSRLVWEDEVPFNKYLQDLFPTHNHPVWSSRHNHQEDFYTKKAQLRATKLVKHLNLTFYPTHDIRDHLRLDIRRNKLHIFHFASFIKANLRTKNDSARVNLFPRQLLLEVLDSTQLILFPLSDAKSRRLLRSLISDRAYGFDPETEKFERSTVCNPGEETISYIYFADRLEELFQELQTPRPRTWLGKQMQRRSGSRDMILATLIGVAVAVLLGVLALILSAVQTWIAYQAWKHPV
ncbi:hypothetical protein F4802DRAFT_611161 [Xylaria palmicola]|nr:hypothetical protein F4802DRAFT_611161 [Xylaria palmicola]